MSRYTTKLQNIQEANARLEQRMLNEQTTPTDTSSSYKYDTTAAKINTKAQAISDKIGQSLVPDEDEKLRSAKMAVANFAASAKKGQKVTPEQLADFAKTNDFLDLVINSIVNKL
jgi:hypothetical protein